MTIEHRGVYEGVALVLERDVVESLLTAAMATVCEDTLIKNSYTKATHTNLIALPFSCNKNNKLMIH